MNIHGFKSKLSKARDMLKNELSKRREIQNPSKISQIKDGMSNLRYKIRKLRSERGKKKKE